MNPPPSADVEVLAATPEYPRRGLAGAHRDGAKPWRRIAAFFGPGYLIAVGYMDPGNWATDLAGGSRFGYALLSVVLLSSIAAMFLQRLALRLGIATNRDLAQHCREQYGRRVAIMLWISCEVAIAACDLAEVIGTAIALKLLFGLPLLTGVCLTVISTLLIMGLQRGSLRYLEVFVIGLIAIVGACFFTEIWLCSPDWKGVVQGLVPTTAIVTDPTALYLALGIFGATVMPHNLYLHSALAQIRCDDRSLAGRRSAMRFSTIDCFVALSLAFLINAAILILSASVFHANGHTGIAEIEDAYTLLSPLMGSAVASVLFAVALLAAGQNSSITGTMAGQIVMEGFLHLRFSPGARRLLTRLVAIVPAVLVIALMGEGSASQLLIFSQVILSLQLGFAVVPLLLFTGNRKIMGDFANSRAINVAGGMLGVAIVAVNAWLVIQFVLA